MKRILVLLFSIFLINSVNAQDKPVLQKTKAPADRVFNDSLNKGSRKGTSNKGLKNLEAKIEMYKIISFENDSTYLDTTLSVKKDYKFNYLRKDEFDLLPFSNEGQTYNTLSHDFSSQQLMPLFGARARHFNYMELEDISYYEVPTPLTELMYKSAFEQGQILDAFFTVNTSKQFNFSAAYKGLRSLGKYQNILTSTGNFRFTTNYKAKSEKYFAKAHVVTQDLLNQENGGILDGDIENFESGNPEFIDRSVFDPAFEDAESILRGKRFHLDHYYRLIKDVDSLSNNMLSIGNVITFTDKYYEYSQDNANEDFFGEAFVSSIKERVTLEDFYAEANATYVNSKLGSIKALIGYNNFNYGYTKLVQLNGNTITNRLKGDIISFGGAYSNTFGKFNVIGKFGFNLSGDFTGSYFNGNLNYKYNDDIKLEASLNVNSKAPNYNYQLYQSDYINYNWQNNFDNVETKQIAFNFKSNKIANVTLDYTTINNYTFFADSNTTDDIKTIKPFQNNQAINYFRIKISKELNYGKFYLNNTIRYQNVIDREGILNVPEIVTRNTLYYANHFFKNNALYLQTGISFSYFTEYNMNAYDPLLAEFYVQNKTKLGGFPRLDFFINAKVRQTRIYLKAEHFNSSFTGYNFYSAPNYPYRDFTVRFGIVWNFFL